MCIALLFQFHGIYTLAATGIDTAFKTACMQEKVLLHQINPTAGCPMGLRLV